MDATAGVEQVASVEEALSGADAAVLVTEWAELADTDWTAVAARMGGDRPVFVDGRNMLDPQRMRDSGWVYESIGRPSA
jgi:UDPglucose 6-dehydrogenase